MSPRTGRPPIDDPRTEIRRVRLSKTEDAEVVKAAEEAQKEPGVWMRDEILAALKRAKRRRSTP